SLLGIVLLGVGLGLLRRHQSILPKSPWTTLMAVYAVFTYVSLCLGSDYLGLAFPFPGELRFSGWREYMMMPVMLLVIIAVQPTKRQMQAIVLALCFGTFALDKSFWNAVSDKEFSTYSEESHEEGGGMGYAGGNGLAAFTAQATAFVLALAGYE